MSTAIPSLFKTDRFTHHERQVSYCSPIPQSTDRVYSEARDAEDVVKPMMNFRRQVKLCGVLGHLFLWFAALAWPGMSGYGQEITRHNQVYLLPPPTGEALTLAPNDMPDLNCSILEWNEDSPKPSLAVLCPPQDTFAPVYLYLKLSWLKPEDVPSSVRSITAQAKTLTKVRTTKAAAWVWLGIKEKGNVSPRQTWMAFNAVADIALLTLSSKQYQKPLTRPSAPHY